MTKKFTVVVKELVFHTYSITMPEGSTDEDVEKRFHEMEPDEQAAALLYSDSDGVDIDEIEED